MSWDIGKTDALVKARADKRSLLPLIFGFAVFVLWTIIGVIISNILCIPEDQRTPFVGFVFLGLPPFIWHRAYIDQS